MKHIFLAKELDDRGLFMIKLRCSRLIRAGIVLILTLAGLSQASGATLTVCPTAEPGCNHTSVQAAVAAANAGDTIQVWPSTYTESGQFFINKDLTITGMGPGKEITVIQPVAGTGITSLGTGWWEIASGVTLNLSNLTLNGLASEEIANPGSGARLRTALYFSGSGRIDSVYLTNFGYTIPMSGGTLHLGWGILQNYKTTSNMELWVTNSVIDNFGGTAIQTDAGNESLTADGSPQYHSSVMIKNNILTCRGAPTETDKWLQYGVVNTGGASASVSGNNISGCYGVVNCADSPTYCGDSSAILVRSTWAKGTQIFADNNLIYDNYTGLYLDLYDYDRGPWDFTLNSLTSNDLDLYYVRDLTTLYPIYAINNWWGQDANPVSNGDVYLDGVGADEIDTTLWIAKYLDDPGKAYQRGFWPGGWWNWKVSTQNISNGSLNRTEDYVVDGLSVYFKGTPNAGYYIAGDTFTSVGECNGGGLVGSTWITGPIHDNSCVVSADFKPLKLAVDGVCGADNTQNLTNTPTNLCTAGIPSAVNGSGPWNWICNGTVGTDRTGAMDYCLANRASYNVTGLVGPGSGTGTISPSSTSVGYNGATSFTLTPTAGSVIDTVEGCGGSLNGNLWTTGLITEPCTVRVSFAATTTIITITNVIPSTSKMLGWPGVSFRVENAVSENDTVIVWDYFGGQAQVWCVAFVKQGFCQVPLGYAPGVHTLIATYYPSGSGQPISSAGINHLVVDAPMIYTDTLPIGVKGFPFMQWFPVRYGQSPYRFTLTGDSLPDGLSLSQDGTLAGIPTTVGNSNITLTVTDALGQTDTRDYLLQLVDTLAIATTSLPDGIVNAPYRMDLEKAGGGLVTWEVFTGTLPDGLLLDPIAGSLMGIPTNLGTSSPFTIRAYDSSQSAFHEYTLTVLEPDVSVTDGTNEVTGNVAVEDTNSTCLLNNEQTFVIDPANYGADPTQPPGTTLVNGLFGIGIQGCTPGQARLTVHLVYPEELPPGAQYWKYGKTADNPEDHWYILPGVIIEGNTITYTITDGGLGDSDLTANGSITDPGGAADPWSVPRVQTGSPVNITLPTNIAAPDTIAGCAAIAVYPLPPGLTFSCATGQLVLTGSPTTPGIYTFAITVTGNTSDTFTEFYRLEIQQGPPVPIPTLSEWAMILLVMGMIGLVGWRHRRQDALRA